MTVFEQAVGFMVQNGVALRDRSMADGLGEMGLAGSRPSERQHILVACDEVEIEVR